MQSHNNQLRLPRWVRHPAPPAGGSLRGPPSFSPLESERCGLWVESFAAEDQLGLFYVVLLRDGGAKSLSLFDLRQELQVFLRSDYFEIGRMWATTKGSVSFWGLSANLVLIGMMLRSKHLPTSHLRPPSRSLFPPPRASRGHLQALQLLWEGVCTQAQGSRCRGVRGALGVRLQRRLRRRCALPPAAREPAASSSGTSTAAVALRRRPEPGVPMIGPFAALGPPLRPTADPVAPCLRHPRL